MGSFVIKITTCPHVPGDRWRSARRSSTKNLPRGAQARLVFHAREPRRDASASDTTDTLAVHGEDKDRSFTSRKCSCSLFRSALLSYVWSTPRSLFSPRTSPPTVLRARDSLSDFRQRARARTRANFAWRVPGARFDPRFKIHRASKRLFARGNLDLPFLL